MTMLKHYGTRENDGEQQNIITNDGEQQNIIIVIIFTLTMLS